MTPAGGRPHTASGVAHTASQRPDAGESAGLSQYAQSLSLTSVYRASPQFGLWAGRDAGWASHILSGHVFPADPGP